LLNYPPALIVEFKSSQLERFVRGNAVDRLPIFKGKHHHVVGGVPTRDDVARDKFGFKAMGVAESSPCGEGDGGRMNDRKGKLPKL
jgi:hypothetical protein